MSYVDGFVSAVPLANKEAYRVHAVRAAQKFKEHGALAVSECWADDVPDGKVTSFPQAVKKKDDEAVVFSWTLWPSKDVRNAAWEKMMQDPEFDPKVNPMPFDGARLIYGGFEQFVSE
jgi:uncharacterized protein YbaA (DUF1428 family)